jgi:hypothetical protein
MGFVRTSRMTSCLPTRLAYSRGVGVFAEHLAKWLVKQNFDYSTPK